MASIDKRKGRWRTQVRRNGQSLIKTFRMKADAETWSRDVERMIDMNLDPTSHRFIGCPRRLAFNRLSMRNIARLEAGDHSP